MIDVLLLRQLGRLRRPTSSRPERRKWAEHFLTEPAPPTRAFGDHPSSLPKRVRARVSGSALLAPRQFVARCWKSKPFRAWYHRRTGAIVQSPMLRLADISKSSHLSSSVGVRRETARTQVLVRLVLFVREDMVLVKPRTIINTRDNACQGRWHLAQISGASEEKYWEMY